jgi:hypothetical protein
MRPSWLRAIANLKDYLIGLERYPKKRAYLWKTCKKSSGVRITPTGQEKRRAFARLFSWLGIVDMPQEEYQSLPSNNHLHLSTICLYNPCIYSDLSREHV